LHVWWRSRQERHPALEVDDCIFLTDRHVQTLLRAVGARKKGIKAGAAAIATMNAHGWIEDTGKTKKPRRTPTSVTRANRFQTHGQVVLEGGKDAQPTASRSYWWRIFRVPGITTVRNTIPQGAYGHCSDVPQRLASLSAFLIRQGLISRRRCRSRPNPGSVQWVFLHSGPP
jgi:hypothetical protein